MNLFAKLLFRIALLLLIVTLVTSAASAQQRAPQPTEAKEIRLEHPWGRFPVGSWKRVRVRTEMLDAKGTVNETSTTETTTTLVKVNDDCFTLKAEVTVEVAGKLFSADPKFLVQGYYGQPCENPVTIVKQGANEFLLNGRRVPTEVRSVSFKEGEGKHVSTIEFAEDTTPTVLHRRTQLLNGNGEPTGVAAVVEVIAVDMPCKVLTEMKSCWHVKTLQTSEKRATVTVEVHCRDIPGGLISHASKTLDETGQPTQRSTLELVDYGIGDGNAEVPQTSRRRIFQRHRGRDSRR
ncbi:MAG: hypothetical protein KDA55_12720 [Planctomycetales bacterium]|nr:hypothetical protein [Planctomycetales bacterium]MCA9209219.1 hypothetical protein [Planctomycetales bacterium]